MKQPSAWQSGTGPASVWPRNEEPQGHVNARIVQVGTFRLLPVREFGSKAQLLSSMRQGKTEDPRRAAARRQRSLASVTTRMGSEQQRFWFEPVADSIDPEGSQTWAPRN